MLGDHTRAALNGAPCAVAIASRGYAQRPEPIAKIGIGYDESAQSKAALAIARELAARTSAQVCALQVVPIATCPYGQWVPLAAAGIEQMAKKLNTRLEDLPDIEADAVYGITGEELAAFGDQVDLLIVGSRAYGPVKRLMLGSTSAYLQRHARCSLLVLPRGASARLGDSVTSGSHQTQASASATV